MDSESINIGDSVLAPTGGNLVPGVVAEVREDQALVSLAQPYLDETGSSQGEVWAPLSQLQKVLDDADTTPQLSA